MWRSCVYWCGGALIAVALVALPATSVVPARLGGTAAEGYVKGGRYFVGSHGRYTAVSASAWRLELWVSRLFPWSILVPAHAGLFLIALSLRLDNATIIRGNRSRWRDTAAPWPGGRSEQLTRNASSAPRGDSIARRFAKSNAWIQALRLGAKIKSRPICL